MAESGNANNWLKTKLQNYYPDPQPEAIGALVEAVTSQQTPAEAPWFVNPFALDDLLIFDDQTLRDLVTSDAPGLGLETLARGLHNAPAPPAAGAWLLRVRPVSLPLVARAPAPLVERVTRALPRRQQARFQALQQQPMPPRVVEAARRQILDHLFWELTYWHTPELYEELTEGERLHPDLFRQLRPDLCGKTVLDAGAGSGRATFACLRQGARHVYAVEPSPGLLRLLEGKLARSGAGARASVASESAEAQPRQAPAAVGAQQITPLRGRFDALPLDSQSVDTALACSAFTAEPDQGGEAGLAELQRVTRRGGAIIVIWPRPEDYQWLAAHGFHYAALPLREEPHVRYRSWRSALRVAGRFHARNRAVERHLLRARQPEVPFSLLGPNPPHDYCWLKV